MQREELVDLLTPESLRLLDEVADDIADDPVALVSRLRRGGHPAGRVATVLTQARLRRRARAKFGEFAEGMLFTEAGLEQASRLVVGAYHAGRFAAAGAQRVADLGCGIGGDALAIAGIGLRVVAVDADEVTAALASYNLASFPHAEVRWSRLEDTDLAGVDAVWLDPARRTSGHAATRRLSDPEEYSPPLSLALALARERSGGVKLGPASDRRDLPEDAEAQWVSVDGDVVELALWFGALRRDGIGRSALVHRSGTWSELTAAADTLDADVTGLQEYLYEPDGAVIRARLLGDLARGLHAGMLSAGIAYLSSSRYDATPFARGFRIVEELPVDVRRLARALRERGIGTLEIKKRGVDLDPARLRTQLSLRGENSATIVLTRLADRRVALLAERMD